jgi:hypothetical protein
MDILESVHAILEATPARWSAVAALPHELVGRIPAAGEWSAAECLLHVLDTERQVFPARVRWLLAGQDFPAFDPDREGSHPRVRGSAADWAKEFAGLRQESLALVSTLRPSDLPCKARHQELGVVTLTELLHEWAGHDLLHLMQAERALMQPLIAGCGPWLPYFAEHRFQESGRS